MSDAIDYPLLLRRATLGVVRAVLERTAAEGLDGDHHFFLTFRTADDGVEIPPALRSRYPESMTVVLQHQFAELAVDEEAFGVTLRFGGAWERIRVPFEALVSFLDPSVPFGLDFTQFAAGAPSTIEESDNERAPSGPVLAPRRLEAVEATDAPAPDRSGDLLPFRRR